MSTSVDAGGNLLCWDEAESTSYTHVVANHYQEPHAQKAAGQGQQVVSLLWLWECVISQHLLPVSEEQVKVYWQDLETGSKYVLCQQGTIEHQEALLSIAATSYFFFATQTICRAGILKCYFCAF